jgi:hypothetical protein
MVNSSMSPRPRLRIAKANLHGRVPINAVYSRHIGSHARLGRSLIYALNPVIQASLNSILPIVGVLFIPNKHFKSDFRWCRTV